MHKDGLPIKSPATKSPTAKIPRDEHPPHYHVIIPVIVFDFHNT